MRNINGLDSFKNRKNMGREKPFVGKCLSNAWPKLFDGWVIVQS